MKRGSRLVWVAAGFLVVAGGLGLGAVTGRFSGQTLHAERGGERPITWGPEAKKSVRVPSTGFLQPWHVVFRDLPVVSNQPTQNLAHPGKRPGGGAEADEKRERSQLSEAEADARRAAAMQQPVRRAGVQQLREVTVAQRKGGVRSTTAADVVNLLTGFDGPDISQCCGSSASVPPDSHLAVGPNHVIATVNTAIMIYNKQGQVLYGPVTSDTFFNSASCSGTFDPSVEYDEGSDRFIINYDGSPNDCIAVSQTGDPTGSWNVYAYDTGIPSGGLFDYPHIGVGDQAIYVGANMFGAVSFSSARVWALDKSQMYAGQTLTTPTPHDLASVFTPMPMVLHGTPSASGTIFIISEANSDNFVLWKWTDPTGVAAPTQVGTSDLAAATGVNANSPIDQPQLGTAFKIQGNDPRPLDAEWRNGHLWMTHQMSCNVGSGPVDCARWAEIDPTDASVIQAGVIAIDGKSISFPNLAVDANNDMALGFTVTGEAKRPSVYIAARLATDPANTLRAAQEVKPGQTIYKAFDGSPGRWGDYSGMATDPDGQHLWYLGEYAKDGLAAPYVPDQYGNWGTFIQQIGFGPDDHIFADGFDPLRASVELHAEANEEDADSPTGPAVNVGDSVQLRYVVINTGQQTLNSIVVTDNQQGTITCPASSLDAGGDMLCNVNVTAADGQYSSSATVTAVAQDSTNVNDTNAVNFDGFTALVGTKCTDAGGAGCPEALVDSPSVGTNGTVTSSFTISGCNTIDDVNVGLSIDHTYIGDLLITLQSPGSTSITLLNSPLNGNDNCGGDNVRTLLDDASSNGSVDAQCGSGVPSILGVFQPSQALSAFNGSTGNGTWTLTVNDVYPQDTGTLNDWSLQLTCH